MTTSNSQFSALLIDAPVGRHFAQLHRDEAALQAAVALFVETGLRRQQSVLVFSAPPTTAALFGRLRAHGMDVRGETEAGRLRVADANASLSRLMRGGMPSWSEFHRAVTDELNAVPAAAAGGTRVYGEMVNLLWRDGRGAAAIRLEEYWNDLAKLYPFTLFCGYTLDTHESACYEHPLSEIARTHTDTDHGDDERFSAAVDSACRELFGVSIDDMMARSTTPATASETALPRGLGRMVWLRRTRPEMSVALLERTRGALARARHAAVEMRGSSSPS